MYLVYFYSFLYKVCEQVPFSIVVTNCSMFCLSSGGHRDVLWPDNWTAATADGSRSAQFEHQMLVTETGVELLTARIGEPKDRMVWSKEKFQR
jgi:hypothetical protein